MIHIHPPANGMEAAHLMARTRQQLVTGLPSLAFETGTDHSPPARYRVVIVAI